jgi:GT2 family glycosyltransferase
MKQGLAFSVVIATHGRPEKLARCLTSLARLRYPHDQFEVIVVDDGSPVDVGAALAGSLPSELQVRFLRQQNLGPGVARNLGVRDSNARWIAFIDDDCKAHPRWLTALEKVLRNQPRSLVGGRIVNGYPHSLFDTASWALLEYLYEYMRNAPDSQRFFATMNVAVARDEFLAMGGFDEKHSFLAEDRDLCDRWLTSGRAMVEAPGAVVVHYHGLNLYRFIRQHMKYGRGARRFHIARAKRRSAPVRLETHRFYLGLVFSPFRLKQPTHRKIALTCCLILSQAAMVAGYFQDKICNPGFGGD